ASTLAAQPSFEIASNPRAVEFDVAAKDRSDILGYRLEIFANGADTTSDQPLKIVNVRNAPSTRNGRIRIPLGASLDGLNDGDYVATLRVIGRGGESARSMPTSAFRVTGVANRPLTDVVAPPAPSPGVQSVPSPPPQPADSDSGHEGRSRLGVIAA